MAMGAGAAVVAALCVTVPATAATPPAISFGPPTNAPAPAGNGGFATATGDVNGDGKADIVAIDYHGNALLVSLGNGDGTFRTATVLPLDTTGDKMTCNGPEDLAVGDLNRDGNLDVAVACTLTTGPTIHGDLNGVGSVVTVFGNGDGTFGAEALHYFPLPNLVSSGEPWAIEIADLNGDGAPEIVSTSFAIDAISVWLNDGTGVFGDGTLYSTTGPAVGGYATSDPRGLAVADFNGDGVPDVVVANYANGASVLYGDGDGGFGPGNLIPLTVSGGTDVAAGDFNGDGRTDFAVATVVKTISVSLNGATGFAAPVTYDVGGSPLGGITAADLDRDGNLDLVAPENPNGGGGPTVLRGDGHGNFTQVTPAPADTYGGEPAAYSVADFNGDGKPDLATADLDGTTTGTAGSAATVFLNTSPAGDGTQAQTLQIVDQYNGLLSASASSPVIDFGRAQDGGAPRAHLGQLSFTNMTPPGSNPWSATIATTDLKQVGGTTTLHWDNLHIIPPGTNGVGPIWRPSDNGSSPWPVVTPTDSWLNIPSTGTDTNPGTTFSPGVTLFTASSTTRGIWGTSGASAWWNIGDPLPAGQYAGTLQYTVIG